MGRSVLPWHEHAFVSYAGILHADLDSFYASVEQRDDPSLRGRPVIVGPGVVLAASYEAKARGVYSGMGAGRARRLCPHAAVVPCRFEAYTEASKEVFRIFEDTAPVVEALSIDEAFLDVRGMERFAGTPAEIAARLRRRVREEVREGADRRHRATGGKAAADEHGDRRPGRSKRDQRPERGGVPGPERQHHARVPVPVDQPPLERAGDAAAQAERRGHRAGRRERSRLRPDEQDDREAVDPDRHPREHGGAEQACDVRRPQHARIATQG